MKNFAFRFLGVAMLGTACAFVFSGESSVGKQVDDSLAASIRGGGECNNIFDYFEPFQYCNGSDDCNTQRPNAWRVGFGTEGLDAQSPCGGEDCAKFTGPKTCAKPATAATVGGL